MSAPLPSEARATEGAGKARLDRPGGATGLTQRQRWQIALITLGAIAVFTFVRWLPTGTNLSHMDFRVDAKNPIDFCDPLNPQFIPVVAVASPVSMTLELPPAEIGREARGVLRLRTASGKWIGPADLLVVHTEKLHLLIIDPTLTDYQHVHPVAGGRAGEWRFAFTPKHSGLYRIFADFTPAATGRGLYANADLNVAASGAAIDATNSTPPTNAWVAERDGYRFQLTPGALPIRVRRPVDLKFSIVQPAGGAVPLQPVMGAFAHLVAFDSSRSGFAHLHPTQLDVTQPPDARHPVLDFKIMIPKPGRYVIWAQVNLGGVETFVPFWFEVTE